MKQKNVFSVFILVLIFLIAQCTYAQKHPPKKNPKAPVHKPHKKVVPKHPPHYKYAKLPKLGIVIAPPASAVIVRHKGVAFRFHNGVWYKPKGNGFVEIRPPVGLRIKVLPPKHKKIIVNNVTYYYYYGNYYQKVEGSEEYEVVDQPIGAVIDALPDGYSTETIDGVEYYVLDGVYYKAIECESGTCYESVDISK